MIIETIYNVIIPNSKCTVRILNYCNISFVYGKTLLSRRDTIIYYKFILCTFLALNVLDTQQLSLTESFHFLFIKTVALKAVPGF